MNKLTINLHRFDGGDFGSFSFESISHDGKIRFYIGNTSFDIFEMRCASSSGCYGNRLRHTLPGYSVRWLNF